MTPSKKTIGQNRLGVGEKRNMSERGTLRGGLLARGKGGQTFQCPEVFAAGQNPPLVTKAEGSKSRTRGPSVSERRAKKSKKKGGNSGVPN